jgi:predicted Zn finger-like uncharacterized protein
MSSIIDCPSCSRQLRVPDDLAGQQVKCPRCGETFSAGFAPPPPAPPQVAEPPPEVPEPPPLPEETPIVPEPPRVSQTPCPNCGELHDPNATRCRLCGEPLTARGTDGVAWQEPIVPGPRRDGVPHRGALILVLGILSIVIGCIGLPLGISAWVMGRGDLAKMRNRDMDPSGEGLTQAGLICGIIGTIWQSLSVCLCSLVFGGWFLHAPQRQGPIRPATKTIRLSADISTLTGRARLLPSRCHPRQ